MALLNSSIIRGNLRVTSDLYTSGTIYQNGVAVSLIGHTHSVAGNGSTVTVITGSYSNGILYLGTTSVATGGHNHTIYN